MTKTCARPTCDRAAIWTSDLCRPHEEFARKAEGRRWVSAAPAIAHINTLRAGGMGWDRLAECSGISSFGLRDICKRGDRIIERNARKILAVKLDPADSFKLPILGSRRRIQALIAVGYNNALIASEIGYARAQFHNLLFNNSFVEAQTARKIDEAFQRLQLVPPPRSAARTKAINRAKKNGWAPPFAWDEDSIDDPDATPILGERGKYDWAEEYVELRSFGLSEGDAAERMGIKLDTLQQRFRRMAA